MSIQCAATILLINDTQIFSIFYKNLIDAILHSPEHASAPLIPCNEATAHFYRITCDEIFKKDYIAVPEGCYRMIKK
jgi:hypothetical protein